MTAPSNLNFATPDPSGPGLALDWTASAISAATGFGSYAIDTWSGLRRRAEGYEGGWPHHSGVVGRFISTDGSATISAAGNGFSNGQVFVVQAIGDTTGLPTGKALFVVNEATNSFGLSETPGGTALVGAAFGAGFVSEPTNDFYLLALSASDAPSWAFAPSAVNGSHLDASGNATLSTEDFSVSAWASHGGAAPYSAVLQTAVGVTYALALTDAAPGMYGAVPLTAWAPQSPPGPMLACTGSAPPLGSPILFSVPPLSATWVPHTPPGPTLACAGSAPPLGSTVKFYVAGGGSATWAPLSPPGSTLLCAGSAPPLGSAVQFSVSTGGSLPVEVNATTTYYVVSSSGLDIEVSATPGGSPITFAGVTGSGTFEMSWPGALPAEVNTATTYYVVSSSGLDIEVSETPGGAPINFAGGTGTGTWAMTWPGLLPAEVTEEITYYVVSSSGLDIEVSEAPFGTPIVFAGGTGYGNFQLSWPGEPADGFEQGWPVFGYFSGPNVVGTNTTQGLYDSGAHDHDGFEGWVTGYFTGPNVTGTNTVQGLYDSTLADTAEAFRAVPSGTWSTQPGGSLPSPVLYVDSGTMPNLYDAVQLTTTGTLPAPFQENTTYWIDGTGAYFTLSATRGGTPITATTTGTGTHSFAADPAYGWPIGGYV